MRRAASLTLFLAMLSVVSGYLLSNSSWIGNVGVSLFYQQYEFLRVWWQGALLVFCFWIFLYAIQSLVQKIASPGISKIVDILAIVAALIGLYLTYHDFRHNIGHRWMGERFHLGAYLIWIGWIIISIYLLLSKRNARALNRKVGIDV